MSETKHTLQEQIKQAMRAKDKARLATLRLISADIKQKEVDSRTELDEAQVLAILDKMLKQRRESISQYEKANRDDLAAVEKAEMIIIQDFLPQALTEAEINTLIDQAVADTSATSIKDMGKVMASLKPQLLGRADTGKVSALVKAKLAG